MAIYNLADPLVCQTADLRYQKLREAGKVIELTDKSAQRTLSQNSYLHLLLQYAAVELGEPDVSYVKQYYYKLQCNADLYVYKKEDKVTGRQVQRVRSSRDLTTEEMTTSIQRFKNWCATVPAEPFYLPDAQDPVEKAAMEAEVYRNRQYLYG